MLGYYIRLGAVVATAAILSAIILNPTAGRRAVEGGARPVLATGPMKACAPGLAPLTGPFAPIDDVLSISPLGAVTAPGEPLPTPYIRINTKRGETVFERKPTNALSPGAVEIVAIERRTERDAGGKAIGESWTAHLKPCEKITLYYDRLDAIEPSILRRAGGLAAFAEIGGPDHLALKTRIRLREGDVVGTADGFDVGLHDVTAAPAAMARPERYRSDAYERAEVFKTPPGLLEAIAPDVSRARCAIEYLPSALQDGWAAKLGDSWGMRRAKGENACRTALVDAPGSAQGAWFTDASHNAVTNKVSAIALAPDSIDPDRLIFALHGRLKSLTPDLVALNPMLDEERARAARDFLTFEKGDGRINRDFAEIKAPNIYCYDRLRVNFVGPRINGVLLVQMTKASTGAELLKIEARGDVSSCIELPEPWSFTGAETTFYR